MIQHFHRIFVIGVLAVAMAIGGAVVSSATEWGPPDSGQWAPVELAQVDIAEVFFPYIYNPTTKKTLYQSAVEKGLGKFLTNKM